MTTFRVLLAAAFLAVCSVPVQAHENPAMEMKGAAEIAKAAGEMSDAANSLLNALDDEQKKKIQFDFKDAEREKFIFVPSPRKGLPLKEMTPAQRPLALALLNTALSHHGVNGVLSVMSLEQILLEAEKDNPKAPKRDPEMYFVEIFGKPGNDQIWAWRFEGHHFSASFTCVMGKTIVVAPLFMGSNPELVKDGPRKGHRTLGEVEDAGRKFMLALNEGQQKKALIHAKTPGDIFSGNKRRVELKKEGVPVAELNKDQKTLLLALINEYLKRDRAEVAAQETARVEKELDTISFAWGGATEPGKTHYYRIQSDTFMIEYDNFQNDGNHVHSVWRDLKNDFGEDVLKRHYAEEHK